MVPSINIQDNIKKYKIVKWMQIQEIIIKNDFEILKNYLLIYYLLS